VSNEVIYRAASHLNVRINEILRGRTIEHLSTEERAKVDDIQQITEALAGLQVDLGAMRAEVAQLSEWKESAMELFSKWDAVGEALIDKPKLGASTAGQALEQAVKFRKRIAELEKSLRTMVSPITHLNGCLTWERRGLPCQCGFNDRINEAVASARAVLAAAERKGEG
jgi:hypothetical protein